ncbi:MAG: decaprenyl-phosphate phosphoribosyltransferase [Ilumatobacter sp.]|uniref:decaprenyl-phosphate phosphoribosyltransferase n=1 Tax=Ilumatobacter sp. TaxID=1967498 RepID=UPI00261D8E80|nr:decaprenyl-phosphate phosphoribosyltransferase [Ilumatobacter sp.]MDJ0771248.1 decaprenyl-phosphate phosphoribosyltransferase [Ilumatobacter sp.]
MHPILRTARPKQWLKNLLVFAAPGAAGVLDEPRELGISLVVFVAFCLASSGTYFWNDVLDVEADRAHPTKSQRPVAAGVVSLGAARAIGTALPIVALGLAAVSGRWQTVAVVAVYLAVTLSYSAIWKHVAVLDLVAIASGFVLRAAAGAVAVDVEMSSWFVLVTTFGSLFIVAGKRFAEARDLGDEAHSVRTTLASYSEGYLRFVLAITSGAAIVSYCVWAFETKELNGSDLPYYELSIVPMLTAFLRYALVLEQGGGAAPEDVFGHDRVMQVLAVVWVLVFGLAVYA